MQHVPWETGPHPHRVLLLNWGFLVSSGVNCRMLTAPGMDHNSGPMSGMCCLQTLKRPTKNCALFSAAGNSKCNNLPFTMKGMSWHVLDHWTPKTCTEAADLWILTEFISCSQRTSVFKGPSFSSCQISTMSLIKWIDAVFCRMSWKSTSLLTMLWQRVG